MAEPFVVDSFVIESGKRMIELQKHPENRQYPWQIHVHVATRWSAKVDKEGNRERVCWTFLSSAEYMDEEVAKRDFEIRRPRMHTEEMDMPMQKGKRLIQEVMTEKLGGTQ